MLIHGRSQLCFKLAQLFLPSSLLPATLLPQTDAQQPSTRDQHLEHLKTGVDGKVSGVRSDLDGSWLKGFKRLSSYYKILTYPAADRLRALNRAKASVLNSQCADATTENYDCVTSERGAASSALFIRTVSPNQVNLFSTLPQ
ncbi:hypothetical protein B0H13DRAFT_1875050 [Mycena leptocephala]|nr:hypothetical protein B0H13DRAFT_1875050 [Mycena leptocephala]